MTESETLFYRIESENESSSSTPDTSSVRPAVRGSARSQERADTPSEKLQIKMRLEDTDSRSFVIEIQFGPNRLVSSEVRAKLP